jgi:hypothetical protein
MDFFQELKDLTVALEAGGAWENRLGKAICLRQHPSTTNRPQRPRP